MSATCGTAACAKQQYSRLSLTGVMHIQMLTLRTPSIKVVLVPGNRENGYTAVSFTTTSKILEGKRKKKGKHDTRDNMVGRGGSIAGW